MFKNCCGCQNTKTKKKQETDQESGVDNKDEGGESNCVADIPDRQVKGSATVPGVTITEPPPEPQPAPQPEPEPEPEQEKQPVTVTKEITPEETVPEITINDTENENEKKTPNPPDPPTDIVVEARKSITVVTENPTETAKEVVSEKSVKPELAPIIPENCIGIPDELAQDLLSSGAILSGCEIIPRGTSATPHPSKRGASLSALPQWLSQDEDDVFELGGTQEPPATPVGRDELALRRHRFFSDLLLASQASSEHKVRFDPLGPTVAGGSLLDSETSRQLEGLINRLEQVAFRLEETSSILQKSNSSNTVTVVDIDISPTSPIHRIGASTMSVAAFKEIMAGPLATYMSFSSRIGGDVATHSNLVSEAFKAQERYLTDASVSPPPASPAAASAALQPTSSKIEAIQSFRETNRGSQHFNHLSAISESIPALGWVAVSPTPAPYVKEMNDAGQFYTNRVLKDFKEKDKAHVEWVKAWVQTLTELQQFVKQYHTTGLVWGGKGNSGPPPPPPGGMPPPPPVLPAGDPAILDDGKDRSALFAEINRGEGITSSLKKVTADMQTHKNAALRSGPAPFKTPQSSATTPVAPSKPVDKPPVFQKEGKKWLVEYHKGNHGLVIDGAEMNNMVYVFKCQDSTLTIKGKLNAVILDSCKKTSVVFDTLVSSVEFVNCQSVQMQVLDKVPTISIDKTDGCQMYLNAKSLDVEIVTSKSSEMNVMVPKANGDYTEYPVPEQFKTTIGAKGLTTTSVDSLG